MPFDRLQGSQRVSEDAMKAAVLKDKFDIAICDVEKPTPGPREVLVKVAACGICGSDVHGFTDLTFPPGTILGHEFAGTIAEIGEEMTGWEIGQRVAVRPCGVCGQCFWCTNGQISLCPTHLETTLGLKTPGAFAEFVAVPDYQLYALPESIAFEQAAQLEPLAVCVHAVRLADVELGDAILIYGAGPLGLLIYQLVRMFGVQKICVVEKSSWRRELAAKLGASDVFDPEGFDAGGLTRQLPKHGADIVFECAGATATIQKSFEVVRKGGRIILLGISPHPVSINHVDWIFKGIEAKASIGYFVGEFEIALELLKSGSIDVESLVSNIIRLDDIVDRGFKQLLSPENTAKILVKP